MKISDIIGWACVAAIIAFLIFAFRADAQEIKPKPTGYRYYILEKPMWEKASKGGYINSGSYRYSIDDKWVLIECDSLSIPSGLIGKVKDYKGDPTKMILDKLKLNGLTWAQALKYMQTPNWKKDTIGPAQLEISK